MPRLLTESSSILFQFHLGDGLDMDFIWSVGEPQGAGARPGRGQAEILADPRPAVSLDRPVDDPQGHARRDHFDHGDLGPRRLVTGGIHHVSGLQHQQPRLFDLDSGTGDVGANRAHLRELSTESNPRFDSFAHLFQGAFGLPYQTHTVMNPSGPQPPLCDLEPAPLAEQDMGCRNADVLKSDLAMAMRR